MIDFDDIEYLRNILHEIKYYYNDDDDDEYEFENNEFIELLIYNIINNTNYDKIDICYIFSKLINKNNIKEIGNIYTRNMKKSVK